MHIATNPVGAVNIEASVNEICTGKPVTFASDVTYTGNRPSYQWLLNGIAVTGPSGNSFTTSWLADGDEVILQITNTGNACTGATIRSLPLNIQVTTLPVFGVSPRDTVIIYNESVVLSAALSGPQ